MNVYLDTLEAGMLGWGDVFVVAGTIVVVLAVFLLGRLLSEWVHSWPTANKNWIAAGIIATFALFYSTMEYANCLRRAARIRSLMPL